MNEKQQRWRFQRYHFFTLLTLGLLVAGMFTLGWCCPEYCIHGIVGLVALLLVLTVATFFKSFFGGGMTMLLILCLLAVQVPVCPALHPLPPPSLSYGPLEYTGPTNNTFDPPPQELGIIGYCAAVVGLGALTYLGMRFMCKKAGIWPTNAPPPPPTNAPPTNPPPITISRLVSGSSQALPLLAADENSFSVFDVIPFGYTDANGVRFQKLSVTCVQSSTNFANWETIASIYLWQNNDVVITVLHGPDGEVLEHVINATPQPPEYVPPGPQNELRKLNQIVRVRSDAPTLFFRLSPL